MLALINLETRKKHFGLPDELAEPWDAVVVVVYQRSTPQEEKPREFGGKEILIARSDMQCYVSLQVRQSPRLRTIQDCHCVIPWSQNPCRE